MKFSTIKEKIKKIIPKTTLPSTSAPNSDISKVNQLKFSNKSKEYAQADYWRADEEKLVEKYFINKLDSLLILGCGAGRTIPYLYKKGYQITAVDYSPEMVREAKEKNNNINVVIEEMDATNLDYKNNSFDYVFFPFHGIDNIYPSTEPCVKEAARVLKKNGVFIFSSHNRWFVKKIHLAYKKYASYHGLLQYRTTPFEYFTLKKYFKNVKIIQRISLADWAGSNWKDKMYKIFPFLNKSTYFVCVNPKKYE